MKPGGRGRKQRTDDRGQITEIDTGCRVGEISQGQSAWRIGQGAGRIGQGALMPESQITRLDGRKDWYKV